MVQYLAWATGYNVVAIPLAAGVLYTWGGDFESGRGRCFDVGQYGDCGD